jgi:aryl carrier-like protein
MGRRLSIGRMSWSSRWKKVGAGVDVRWSLAFAE